MDIVIVGIDLDKNSCSVAGLNAAGRVILRGRMRRETLEGFVSGLGRCVVAMEACCGAHHLGPRCEVDVAGICPPICEVEQERRFGRRGDRRSGEQTDNAVCCGQERKTIRYSIAPPGAGTARVGAHGADQSSARRRALRRQIGRGEERLCSAARSWVVERSFARATRCRRLVKDYERYAETLAGFHIFAFACIMLKSAAEVMIQSA
jgi:hypothetical protein